MSSSVFLGFLFLILVLVVCAMTINKAKKSIKSNYEGSPVLPNNYSEAFITEHSDESYLKEIAQQRQISVEELKKELKKTGPTICLVKS